MGTENARPGSQARKRFGQNFLHDPNVIGKIIASVAPKPSDRFLEIGPGRGALTRELAKASAYLDVIEIDRELAAALRSKPWAKNVNVHVGDALKLSLGDIASAGISTQSSIPNAQLRIVGNLPYNISTPLLFHLMDSLEWCRDIHVMLQKEVVARMTAVPNSKTYGRLTVALAAFCEIESLFSIGPGAFNPAPQVDSAFARLVPLPQPLVTARTKPTFDRLVRTAFGQRRKQLANALSEVVTVDTIRAAGIDPHNRAENLSVNDYVALTESALAQN